MKTRRRIAAVVVVTLGLLAVAVFWGLPILTSIEIARKASAAERMVPNNLDDVAASTAPGKTLSYFGYDFEVPWRDLDESKTELYPKEHPNRVVLTFRSGLRLGVTTFPAKKFVSGIGTSVGLTPQRSEAAFGNDDYEFLRRVYEFTPDKMHRWSLSPDVHARETFLLTIKSVSLTPWAKDGIFTLQNRAHRGFQQGSPRLRSDGIVVDLYCNDGGVELLFDQKKYDNSAGLTQPEINRVVQSLRKREQS